MKISRYREPSGLILTHFGSRHTYEDAIGALSELSEINKGSPEIYEIVIHEEDLLIDVSREKIEELKERVKEAFRSYRKGAVAFVAKKDLIFGMCRQLELIMDNEKIAIAVFRTEQLAREWIKEIQHIHRKGG